MAQRTPQRTRRRAMPPRGRRLLALGVPAVVTGVLVAGVVSDASAQMGLHRSRADAAAATAQVQAMAARLGSVAASLRTTVDQSDSVRAQLGQVTAELTTARARLAGARSGASATSLALSVVHACAAGVSRSAAALKAGSSSQAVTALRAVAPACESLLSSTPGGPVYPYDFADPDLVVSGGTYYAYGTNSTAGNIQIMSSTDLQQWRKVGDALPALPAWARPGDTWAPAVIRLRHSYLLYYTAARASDGSQCISVGSARRPQGPFTDDSAGPLLCQPSLGGSIDPSPYLDGAGRPYLAWKSIGAGGAPATIWAQALRPAGTSLTGGAPVALLRPDRWWEGSVVEAPSMVSVAGGEDLFFSAGNWDSAGYGVGVARCAGPLGPCRSPAAPLLSSEAGFAGPGGESVFTDRQGTLEMAFAAWLPGEVGYPHSRLLFIRRLTVVDGVPEVGAAS